MDSDPRIETADDAIRQFLQHPAAAKFASLCAAFLRARESLRQPAPEQNDKSAAAVHEAGHVVGAASLGVVVEDACLLDRGGRWGGYVTPSSSDPLYGRGITPEKIGAFIMVYLSGYVGERASGRRGVTGSAHDVAIAFYLAKAVEFLEPKITPRAALRAGLACAQAAIATNDAAWRRVSAALVQRTALDRGQLAALLGDVTTQEPAAWVALARNGGGSVAFAFEEECLAVADAIAGAAGQFEPEERSAVVRGHDAATAEIQKHERAALLFSGGKESLVLAHMLQPYRERITLVWVNTGAMFPHMVKFIRDFAERSGYAFVELHSDQTASFAAHGWPSNVIPVYSNPAGKTKTIPWTACCARLRCEPALRWMGFKGIRALIHGQREQDGNALLSFHGHGVEIAPLWDWSTPDVYQYIERHGIELPEQYSAGYSDSGECWNCTADIDADRFRWMRKRYPELLLDLVQRIAKVYGEVDTVRASLKPAFDEALAGYDALNSATAAERI